MQNQFTIIIPVYNSAEFIEKTLDSVVNQSLSPSEVILIDDGSIDSSIDVIQKYFNKIKNFKKIKFKLLQQNHKGPGSARNKGIEFAKSDWICFLDSDDIWSKNKLERVNEYINYNNNYNFFCHNEKLLSLRGKNYILKYGKNFDKLNFHRDLYYKNMFSTSAVTLKRSIFNDHRKFDEYLMSAQDYDLWLKIRPFINPYFINEVLGIYIERKDNITSGKLLNRFQNELLIANRYRGDVSKLLYIKKLFRILLAFIYYYLMRNFNL